jgi:hypothetical protein
MPDEQAQLHICLHYNVSKNHNISEKGNPCTTQVSKQDKGYENLHGSGQITLTH